MRGLILSSAIDPVLHSNKVEAQGDQGSSYKRQASSVKQQAFLNLVPRIEARDTSLKQQAASSELR